MIRFALFFFISLFMVGCHKADPVVAPAEKCPCPDQGDLNRTGRLPKEPKEPKEPDPEPKCPKCPPKGPKKVETRTVISVVKELSIGPNGGLSVLLEGDKLPYFVAKDADLLIDGRPATPHDVLVWFKQLREPARVKLLVSVGGFTGTRAEFWVDKK